MIQIIPAIDIINGECVRLTQGDYTQQTTYYKDPLDVALKYEDCGIKRLHIVDLDGAKAAKPLNLEVLKRIASATSLDIQYGGGIKSSEALQAVFDNGAQRAICGSIAVTNSKIFEMWLTTYGPECIILGADTMNGFVSINGWQESATLSVEDLISQFQQFGLKQVICTDILRDGMLQGPSTALYVHLQKLFPQIDITVSGGISKFPDIEELEVAGLRSVIVGKAIYEGRITFDQLSEFQNK